MREKIHRIVKHPLISGSATVLVGAIGGNFFNYIFNLSMGRLLSVVEYGVLASLISIVNIFFVFSSSIITVFTKFTASYAGRKKQEMVVPLLKKGNLYTGMLGLVLSGIIALLGEQIANFLHIKDVVLIYLIAILLLLVFLTSVMNGILQGLLRFTAYSVNYILYTIIKVLLGVSLVLLGFNLFGAVLGMVLSASIGYLLLFIPLRDFIKRKNNAKLALSNFRKELTKYAFPVFLSGLGMTMITSIDIVLVKHFFSEIVSGQYAALSLMGRSIFYAISPITYVFFPLIAQKKERKESLLGTILLSAVLIGVPSLLACLAYFFFPGIVLGIFFPAKIYASLAPSLGPFSVFIVLYTLSFCLNSYYLSIGRTRVFIFTLTATIVEILFIAFFHENISQIINGLIVITGLLTIVLLAYNNPHKKIKNTYEMWKANGNI